MFLNELRPCDMEDFQIFSKTKGAPLPLIVSRPLSSGDQEDENELGRECTSAIYSQQHVWNPNLEIDGRMLQISHIVTIFRFFRHIYPANQRRNLLWKMYAHIETQRNFFSKPENAE
jgi:hypothetical protein